MNVIERINLILEAPLTPQQRRKRAIVMKRLAPKIARKRKIAMKRKAGVEKIVKRAQKAAKTEIRNKILKTKKYNDLSYAERINLDKKLQQKQALIKKLSKKLIPVMRKKEIERLKSMRKDK